MTSPRPAHVAQLRWTGPGPLTDREPTGASDRNVDGHLPGGGHHDDLAVGHRGGGPLQIAEAWINMNDAHPLARGAGWSPTSASSTVICF